MRDKVSGTVCEALGEEGWPFSSWKASSSTSRSRERCRCAGSVASAEADVLVAVACSAGLVRVSAQRLAVPAFSKERKVGKGEKEVGERAGFGG